DQSGQLPLPIRYLEPVIGNGCTKIDEGASPAVPYATHRPSCENTADVALSDSTSPNRAVVRAGRERGHRRARLPFPASQSTVRPSGDHELGTWPTPASALVRRSASRLPSASCQKIAASPSRSD